MKKFTLCAIIILFIPFCACTFEKDDLKKIDIEDLYNFLKNQEYNFAIYDDSSEEYSNTIYYVGEKGLGRELLEAERQVSSQRALAFTLSDGSSAYVLIGEILEEVSISKDIVIEFTQTVEKDMQDPYVCNTVYIFNNIVISSISNNYGKVVDESISIEFNYELSGYIKQYLDKK